MTSVLVVGPAREHHHELTELLSRTAIVTDHGDEPLESIGEDLVGAHDVVVLACPPEQRVEELRRAIQSLRNTHVVVVVHSDAPRTIVRRALDAGAAGFVWWSDIGIALLPTVQAVCAGQLAIPLAHRDQLVPPALTTREKQILALVVLGLRNVEIAEKLYLAESTIKSHLSSAFGKLGVRSRNEATTLILDPESGVGPGILRIPSERLGP